MKQKRKISPNLGNIVESDIMQAFCEPGAENIWNSPLERRRVQGDNDGKILGIC